MTIRLAAILSLWMISLSCQKQRTVDPSSNDYVETDPTVLTPEVHTVNHLIGGYYAGLPAHYQQSSKRYPLIVFIHGAGQLGDGNRDLHLILNDGLPEWLDEKIFPSSFTVNGKNYSFIILMPQFSAGPMAADVNSFIDYARKNYRIDTTRIYLSGLSMGGTATCDAATDSPSLFAAIVPISGVSNSYLDVRCQRLADGKLPIWVFHNNGDQATDIAGPTYFVSLINADHPAIPPRFTILPPFGLSGHDAWTRATDPLYKENNMNIYEWMLQYAR